VLATGCYITPVIVENTKSTQKKYNPQNMKNTTLEREKVAYKREILGNATHIGGLAVLFFLRA